MDRHNSDFMHQTLGANTDMSTILIREPRAEGGRTGQIGSSSSRTMRKNPNLRDNPVGVRKREAQKAREKTWLVGADPGL